MSLKSALSKIDASLEAYRALLRDNPEDYGEAADRQQEAADLLDEAQSIGLKLKGAERGTFNDRFTAAVSQIEVLETKRVQGGDDEEEPDGEDDEEPTEVSENEAEEEKAEMYSSLSHDPEEDEETPDENSETE